MQAGRWVTMAAASLATLVAQVVAQPVDGAAPAAAAPAPAPPAAAAAPQATGAPAIELVIDAPEPLRALLARHLDLARLAVLRGEAAVDLRRLIAAAPAQVHELAKTEGYFEPVVEVASEAGPPLKVRLSVVPGPRATVAEVDLQVEGEFDQRIAARDTQSRKLLAQVESAGALRAGSAFRNADWSEAKLKWLTALRAGGYAAAALRSSQATVDVATASVRLEAVVDSGPLFRAGALRVEGLSRHDESTVRDLAELSAGKPLTERELVDFQNRLIKTGLYSSVAVSYDTTPDQASASTVTVRLTEQPLQQATVGVGMSTDTGARASVEHSHRRLFGQPLVAQNKVEWGTVTQRWNGDLLTHPGVDFDRWMFGVQIENERSDDDAVLSQRLRFGRTQDTTRLERLLFAELLRSRQTLDDGGVVDARALSANLHLLLRQLDSLISPTEGASLSLQLALGQARSNTGENGPYARLYGRFTGYLPLPAQWQFKARLELGQIVKRDTVVVPDALGFRAGGDESVRGYEYRSLAPTVNGDVASGMVLFTASAELAHPIVDSMPSLLGAVFVDAGRAANRWQDVNPALGYGVGVRWRSPVGPLRADIAWADEARDWRVHFAVGVVF